MWVIWVVIAYFLLALLVPTAWALGHTWRLTKRARCVTCPEAGGAATLTLDTWYAVRMHALGNPELRVLDCERWPARRDCGRECLTRIGAAS